MANDYFYFKNLDIIGMLDDMESNFAKELQKSLEKHGGILWKNAKMKSPVDTGQLKTTGNEKLGMTDIKIKIGENDNGRYFYKFFFYNDGETCNGQGDYSL